MESVRVQKIIADAGLASRREAEEWIREGRVRVNGQVVGLGDRADPDRDAIADTAHAAFRQDHVAATDCDAGVGLHLQSERIADVEPHQIA
jgi:16S rRNA U516 pseudouridylate synthase RsuA-like enzyme